MTSDSSFTSPGGTCTSCRGSTPSWFVTCTPHRCRSGRPCTSTAWRAAVEHMLAASASTGVLATFSPDSVIISRRRRHDARKLGGGAPRRGPLAPRLPKSTGRGIRPRSGAARAPRLPPLPLRPRRARRPRRCPRQSREAGRNDRLGLRTDTASLLQQRPRPTRHRGASALTSHTPTVTSAALEESNYDMITNN